MTAEAANPNPGERILEAGRRIYAAHQAEKALPHRTAGEAVCEALMTALGGATALASGIGGPIDPEQLAVMFEQAADRAEEALAEVTGTVPANWTNQDESAG